MTTLNLRLLHFIFICCLLFIFYSATTSNDISDMSFSSDKANHFAAFFVLTLLMDLSYPNKSLLYKTSLLLAYGFIIECVQWQLPTRSFSLLDLAADSAGIMAYWIIATLYLAINAKLQKIMF